MKTKILHVIDHLGPGGAQVELLHLLEQLQGDYEFALFSLAPPGKYSLDYRKVIRRVIERRQATWRWNPTPVIGLSHLIKIWRPAVVHTHLFKSTVLGTLAGKRHGCKLVLHDHTGILPQTLEHYFPLPIRQMYLGVYRRLLRQADGVIVLTEREKRGYSDTYGADGPPITVVPYGIEIAALQEAANGASPQTDLKDHHSLSADAKVVMMVGRLEQEKDWPAFLAVAEKLSRCLQAPLAFFVVGSGSLEPALRRYAAARGLSNVYFLGFRSDVPALLRQADLFILTSRRESFGLVLLEAMALGCPVIATRCGGPEDIIQHGQNGFLVEIGDVDEIADLSMGLLNNPDLHRCLVENGNQTVRSRYSLSATAGKLSALYSDLIAGAA